MRPREVSKELRLVQEKYKNVITLTFQPRISDMAKDAADAIDSLQAFVNLIGTLTTCNECADKNCIFRPALGETVRYNCPLFLKRTKYSSLFCFSCNTEFVEGSEIFIEGGLNRCPYCAVELNLLKGE